MSVRSCLSFVSILASTSTSACLGSSNNPTGTSDAGPSFDATPGSDSGSVIEDSGADGGVDSSTTDAAVADSGNSNGAARGIYVTNAGSNAVVVLPLSTSGNVAPLRVIAGATTGLSLPIGVTVDASGNLYVANRTGAGVTVYPPTANGDVAPTKTLASSGMLSAQGIALGASGDVFVSTCPSCGQSGGGDVGVYHFPSGSTSSDRSLGGATNAQTLMTNPGSIALDDSGDLWVGNAFGGVVETFPSSASGDVAPTSSNSPGGSFNLQSLAFGAGTVFVSDSSAGIEEYGVQGDGGVSETIPPTSLSLSYPAGMFVDARTASPVLYVVDFGANAIHVVQLTGAPGAWVAGTVTTISGTATQLNQPLDIAVVF
jgi:sugar lactone lactonase YvrE